MKNEVRPIDANATIEALRANSQQGSWYGCEEPCYQIAEDTIAEMPTLTDHFPNLKKMIPLTLEQLRKMDGQPVLVKCLNSKKYTDPPIGWRIVERSITGTIGVWNGESCFAERDYGVDWLSYAYPPAHIDREAWEPCIKCNGKCYFCKFNETSKCGKCKNHEFYSPMFNFCPDCGRPLTEEAWVELEKRMGVR